MWLLPTCAFAVVAIVGAVLDDNSDAGSTSDTKLATTSTTVDFSGLATSFITLGAIWFVTGGVGFATKVLLRRRHQQIKNRDEDDTFHTQFLHRGPAPKEQS